MTGRLKVSQMSMKVMFLIDSLDASGGAEQAVAAMSRSFIEAGLRVDVGFLEDRTQLLDTITDGGASVFQVPGRSRFARTVAAYRLIDQRRPDVVHTTLFEADVIGRTAARAAAIPVVTSLVNVPYGPDHLRDPRLKPWRVRSAWAADLSTAQLAVRFHAISAHVADTMSRRLLIPRRRIDVVPRGRDIRVLGNRSRERSCRARSSLGLEPGQPVVLAAARHEYQKGLDVLLAATPALRLRHPRVVVLVAGRQGMLTSTLEEDVRRLGIRSAVRFLGRRLDVPDLLCAADVFVLPSRWEGLGSVLLEAMALEAPIVATSLPPVAEVLQDSVTGLLVRPEDPPALAAAISASLCDPAGARKRAALARDEFVRRFEIHAVTGRMLSFYERALGRRSEDRDPLTRVPA